MKLLLSILFPALMLLQVSAQETTALKLQRHPVAGKQFSISYNATGTVLQKEEAISGIAFFYDAVKRTGKERFSLKKSNALWVSDIKIPDQTVLIDLVFTSENGEIRDNNNNKGYLFPVYKNDQPVQFAYAKMSDIMGEGPPDEAGIEKDHPRALTLMKKELFYHPESEKVLGPKFYNMLINSPEPEDKKLLVQKLSALKSDKEEELMMACLYLGYLGEKQQADSLDHLLRTKFPSGQYVFQKGIQEIKEAKEVQQKIALYNTFVKQFPEAQKQEPQAFDLISLYQDMASTMLEKGDEKAAVQYVQLIHQSSQRASFYNKTALKYLKEKNADKALIWADKAIEQTDTTKSNPNWDPYLTKGKILLDKGDYDASFNYAYKVYERQKSKDATELYVQLLITKKRLTEAKAILEESVRKGQASVQMQAQLKEIYESTKGNVTGFEGYLTSLQQPVDASKRKHLSDKMLFEPVQGIVLKDLDGKEVDLATLKGKIVVLDFWATWCKPCIASFPAMQKVMEKYPDVVFLFIATFEKGDAVSLVKQFKKENPYPFKYLIDEKLPGKESYKAFLNYKVANVPYKVVLDKQGNIRFRSSGFLGNDNELINEMSGIIDILKKD